MALSLERLERNLKAFDWLALDRWNANTIMSSVPMKDGSLMCKVCDEIVAPNTAERHVKQHVTQMKEVRRKQKIENARLAREEKMRRKRERDLEKQLLRKDS